MSILSKISIHSDERSARLAGIALMLAGVCMFAFGDALGKVLVASYPVSELLLLRAAVPLAILLALIWRQRATLPRLERPGLQLLRMVLSTAEVAAFFVAVVYLPLADVITYYLACPIFVTALSAIILREQVGWRRWSAVVVGFCGVLIALQPSAQTVSWPALIALGGEFFLRGADDRHPLAARDAGYRAGRDAVRRHVQRRPGARAVCVGDAGPAGRSACSCWRDASRSWRCSASTAR